MDPTHSLNLIQAIGQKDLDGARQCVAAGEDLEAVNFQRREDRRTATTPLILAASLGWRDGVDWLLKAGANPNTTADGQTALLVILDQLGEHAAPLQHSIKNPHQRQEWQRLRVGIFDALVDAGANPDAGEKGLALWLAAHKRIPEQSRIIERLVDAGALWPAPRAGKTLGMRVMESERPEAWHTLIALRDSGPVLEESIVVDGKHHCAWTAWIARGARPGFNGAEHWFGAALEAKAWQAGGRGLRELGEDLHTLSQAWPATGLAIARHPAVPLQALSQKDKDRLLLDAITNFPGTDEFVQCVLEAGADPGAQVETDWEGQSRTALSRAVSHVARAREFDPVTERMVSVIARLLDAGAQLGVEHSDQPNPLLMATASDTPRKILEPLVRAANAEALVAVQAYDLSALRPGKASWFLALVEEQLLERRTPAATTGRSGPRL